MQLPGLAHTHCCSACFSTPSADTAWEKEDESFGLGLMQENPTKTSALLEHDFIQRVPESARDGLEFLG